MDIQLHSLSTPAQDVDGQFHAEAALSLEKYGNWGLFIYLSVVPLKTLSRTNEFIESN